MSRYVLVAEQGVTGRVCALWSRSREGGARLGGQPACSCTRCGAARGAVWHIFSSSGKLFGAWTAASWSLENSGRLVNPLESSRCPISVSRLFGSDFYLANQKSLANYLHGIISHFSGHFLSFFFFFFFSKFEKCSSTFYFSHHLFLPKRNARHSILPPRRRGRGAATV